MSASGTKRPWGIIGATSPLAAALLVFGSGALAWAEPPPEGRAAPALSVGSSAPERLMSEPGRPARAAARFGRRHTPSPLIYPDQRLTVRFSHKVHAPLQECRECHRGIRSSLRARDHNLPDEASCLRCHTRDPAEPGAPAGPPSRCDTCHAGFVPDWLSGAGGGDTRQVKVFPPRTVIPTPNLNFNHKLHLDSGARCETCHGDLSRVELATRDNALPLMGTCLSCHDGERASKACATCHLTRPDGRVQTRLEGRRLSPAGWYRADAHDDAWRSGHGSAAALGDGYCERCHTQDQCMDCHRGIKRPLALHPNSWILTHPIAARRDSPHCASCHQSQTFCVDCHRRTRVAPEVESSPTVELGFHPEGWVDVAGRRGASLHSIEAQRNIRACASCHAEATCLKCHSTRGAGVDPHPPGFVASGACRRMRDRNDRVCVKCHDPGSAAFGCRR